GKQFALAVEPGTIAVCDRDGRELRRFAVAEGRRRVGGLAFSPDGKWIVSGVEDTSVRVWEAATGKRVARFDGHDSPVEQVAVAPDGRFAFSAGGDGFVCQWDLTPRPPPRPNQQPGDLWTAAAEPDPVLAVPAAWALVIRSEEPRAFVAE